MSDNNIKDVLNIKIVKSRLDSWEIYKVTFTSVDAICMMIGDVTNPRPSPGFGLECPVFAEGALIIFIRIVHLKQVKTKIGTSTDRRFSMGNFDLK